MEGATKGSAAPPLGHVTTPLDRTRPRLSVRQAPLTLEYDDIFRSK